MIAPASFHRRQAGDVTPVRAAVLGATGFVGRALVPLLAERGEVLAVSRRGARQRLPGVRALAADVTGRSGRPRRRRRRLLPRPLARVANFADLDRRAAANVAIEAERAGVSQIIYLGGLGEEQPTSRPSSKQGETAAALASRTVPVTTLRAAVVVGQGSAAFETIVSLVDRLPVMVAPRWVSTPRSRSPSQTSPATSRGVAEPAETLGESFDVGGPEILTYGEMIQRIARIRGRRPLSSGARPEPATVLVLATSRHTRPGAVARPLIEGMRNPTVAREQRIRSLLPFPSRASARRLATHSTPSQADRPEKRRVAVPSRPKERGAMRGRVPELL